MFTTIFSHINDLNALKAVATEIASQINSAYAARAKELTEAAKKAVPEKNPFPTGPITPVKRKTEVITAKTIAKKQAATQAEQKAVKAEAKETAETEAVKISITDKAALQKLGLTFEMYNERCWVLRGNTKPIKDELRSRFHGVFNSRLQGGEGWVFRTADSQVVADALGIKVEVA